MYKYKTKNGLPGFIPGVGATDENGYITLTAPIESPAFEVISEEEVKALEGEIVDAAPAPVAEQAQVSAPAAGEPQQITEGTL